MGLRERLANVLLRSGGLMAMQVARAWRPVRSCAVVTYHHIHDPDARYPYDPDTADATPDQFRRQMLILKRNFSVIGLDHLARGLDGGALPPNPCVITFDDGYRSNLTVALPILRDLDLTATFFIATCYATERRLYWWDRIAYLVTNATRREIALEYPAKLAVPVADRAAARAALVKLVKNTRELDLERFLVGVAAGAGVPWDRALERKLADEMLMTWDEIRGLAAAGMQIESHSHGHRVLETMTPAALAEDLAQTRVELARELKRPSTAIAYPVGRSIARHPEVRAAVAKAGFELGFTNASGVIDLERRASLDRLGLARMAVDRDLSDAMFLAQLVIPRLGYQRDASMA